MRKTILWCASDLIQQAVYLNQGKFFSRPKYCADVLQYTFSFQAFIPHRPWLWKLLIPLQQALALRDASWSRVQKLNQFATANVSSLITVLDIVPCTMQNQVKSASSSHLLTETEYSKLDLSIRPQLTTILLMWKGIICLKLISTKNRAGTFRHLKRSIRHLQPETESTFLLSCLLTWVLTISPKLMDMSCQNKTLKYFCFWWKGRRTNTVCQVLLYLMQDSKLFHTLINIVWKHLENQQRGG